MIEKLEMQKKQLIESLTPEQEAMIPVYAEKYTNKFFNYQPINKEKATEFFQWVYNVLMDVDLFKDLYVVRNPIEAQALANKLCETEGVRYPFSGYGSAEQSGTICLYSFVQDELGIQLGEEFNKVKELIELNVYDSILFDEAVILVELPTEAYRNGNSLHREDGPAIKFGGDYEMYFWNGVSVPKKMIMDKSSITKDDILLSGEDVQQCFKEALGEQVYESIILN